MTAPEPRFIQLSTLTSYPAALLNRDDSGLAKRILFGGAMRTRVSSQCLKRHWRTADDEYALANIGPDVHNALRSRAVFEKRIFDPLVEEGLPDKAVLAVLEVWGSALYGKKGKEDEDGGNQSKSKKKKNDDQNEEAKSLGESLRRKEVVVLGLKEIEFIRNKTAEICREANGDPKTAAKLVQDRLKDKAFKSAFNELKKQAGAGVDAAMFGRFVSSDPDARITSAVHVAHALTVHEESSEADYFTAVDDLLTATEGGSGHLGAAELTSGLYYNYVVIDVRQLTANLEGVEPERWLAADRALAARLVKHLIHLMSRVSPGAKLGATAPYDHAGLVLAEAGARQPRTLANAFLDPAPLEAPDLFGRTVASLTDYLASMDAMYGGHEQRWLACRIDASAPDAARTSVPELADAVEQCILQAGGDQ